MNYKSIAGLLMIVLVVLFLGLYVSQMTGYYEYTESRKTTLTEDAIKRFEQDVKEGKEINAQNYLEEEADYNNILSKFGMKLSSLIEQGFNKAMNGLFNEISKTISNSIILK